MWNRQTINDIEYWEEEREYWESQRKEREKDYAPLIIQDPNSDKKETTPEHI